MREKIHYLKFCMSCSAGQAGHLASPLAWIKIYMRTRNYYRDRSSVFVIFVSAADSVLAGK